MNASIHLRIVRVAALLALVVCAHAADLHSGWWRGREVTYRIVDGVAVTDGDILLEEVQPLPDANSKTLSQSSIAIDRSRLWPDGVIPYEIDPDLPDQKRVTDAVAHWNDTTPVKLVPRTGESAYVKFVKGTGCSSFVGRIGREQRINLSDGCSTGATIHEIGHAAGLYHEQSRQDRDFHVRINYSNIDKESVSNFDQELINTEDLGPYDFGSIMHYGVLDFSRNNRPVIESIPAGIPVRQRSSLSAADIEAVYRLYGRRVDGVTVDSVPSGLEVLVDGIRVRTPAKMSWTAGEMHSVQFAGPQVQGSVRYLFGRWSDGGDAAHTLTVEPDVHTYTVSTVRQYRLPLLVSPSGAGAIEFEAVSHEDGWFTDGTEVTIRAVPSPGWNFRRWTLSGYAPQWSTNPAEVRITIAAGFSQVTAQFAQSPVTTLMTDPPGLNILVDGREERTPNGFAWAPGERHTISIPKSVVLARGDTVRHTFIGWSDGGEMEHTITVPENPTTLVAKFKTEYKVSTRRSSGGTISVSPASEDGFYENGTALHVTAEPEPGYRFLGWGGDLEGSEPTAFPVVNDQTVLGAVFSLPRNLSPLSVVNAASYLPTGAVAPRTFVAIFAAEIGTDPSVRVLFDNLEGTIVGMAPNQINAVVPAAVSGRGGVTVRLEGNGWRSNGRLMEVRPAQPALFTLDQSGRGQAAALNQDNSVNTAQNPAPRGSVIQLFLTGGAGPDTTVRIGGKQARVLYAGQAPALIEGVQQINAEIPIEIPRGDVPIVITTAGVYSVANVSIAVR